MNLIKKLISATLAALLICTLTACKGSEITTTDNNTDSATHESTENIVAENENGVSLNGSVVSWGNMEVDNPDLNLTEDQIDVLRYFDTDFLYVQEYNNLQRYPAVYKNAQIQFEAVIKEVIESDDKSFKCLVDRSYTIDASNSSEITPNNKELIVITGNYVGNARFVKGDCMTFMGRYIDSKSFEINGKSSIYPYVSINHYYKTCTVLEDLGQRFDADYISKTAKILFGENTKIRTPEYEKDFDFNGRYFPEYYWYLATPDNQSNANLKSFELPANGGKILVPESETGENQEKNIFVSADFQHFIVTDFEKDLHIMYLDYYDKNFNKIWGREFKDIDNAYFDYTNDYIYFAANNDLYVVSTKDGKDKFSPVMVGEKIKINVTKDGIILIGKGNKDNIMKTDFDGNVLWKTSVKMEVLSCSTLQIVNGNIVASIKNYRYNQKGYLDKETAPKNGIATEAISIDGSNGEIIAEFDDSDLVEKSYYDGEYHFDEIYG